jgi:hypothetical protein
MKVTLESTTQIVTLETASGAVPARLWQGHTDQGTPCHAFITRIAPTIPQPLPPDIEREFTSQLQDASMKPRSPLDGGIPLKYFLD